MPPCSLHLITSPLSFPYQAGNPPELEHRPSCRTDRLPVRIPGQNSNSNRLRLLQTAFVVECPLLNSGHSRVWQPACQ